MDPRRRVFVSFAVEDKRHRDLLVERCEALDEPVECTDFPIKEPWSDSWKAMCRQRIRACDGTIALLSGHVEGAVGARWEIRCAVEEDVPLLGVRIPDGDDYRPPELRGRTIVPWSWDEIAGWVTAL